MVAALLPETGPRAGHRLYFRRLSAAPGTCSVDWASAPCDHNRHPSRLTYGRHRAPPLLLNPGSNKALDEDVLSFAARQAAAAAADGPGRAAWLFVSDSEVDVLEELLREDGQIVFRLRAGDDSPFEQWRAALPALTWSPQDASTASTCPATPADW